MTNPVCGRPGCAQQDPHHHEGYNMRPVADDALAEVTISDHACTVLAEQHYWHAQDDGRNGIPNFDQWQEARRWIGDDRRGYLL